MLVVDYLYELWGVFNSSFLIWYYFYSFSNQVIKNLYINFKTNKLFKKQKNWYPNLFFFSTYISYSLNLKGKISKSKYIMNSVKCPNTEVLWETIFIKKNTWIRFAEILVYREPGKRNHNKSLGRIVICGWHLVLARHPFYSSGFNNKKGVLPKSVATLLWAWGERPYCSHLLYIVWTTLPSWTKTPIIKLTL